MITSENILIHELVGLETEIISSSNSQLVGMTGLIVDESKSLLIIKTKNGLKKIPKNHNVWKFLLKNNSVFFEGSKICKRPEDRLRIKV